MGANSEAMSIPFEFVIGGPVVSQQARSRQRRETWKQDVQQAARERWTGVGPIGSMVAVTITYFFEEVELDVDNIPKPILDALKGVVFSDDEQVSDLLCRKRDLSADLLIRNPSAELMGYLRNLRQVVHIQVSDARSLEVSF